MFVSVLTTVITVVVLMVISCYWFSMRRTDSEIADYVMPTNAKQRVRKRVVDPRSRVEFNDMVRVRVGSTCPENLYQFMLAEWLPFVSIVAHHRHAKAFLLHGRKQWNSCATDSYFEQIANEYHQGVILISDVTSKSENPSYCIGTGGASDGEKTVNFLRTGELEALRETVQFVKHTVLTLQTQSDIVVQLTDPAAEFKDGKGLNETLQEAAQRTIQEYPELKIRIDSPVHRSTNIVTQLRLYINAKAVIMAENAGCVLALFARSATDRRKSALVFELGRRGSTLVEEIVRIARIRHVRVSHARQISTSLRRNFPYISN